MALGGEQLEQPEEAQRAGMAVVEGQLGVDDEDARAGRGSETPWPGDRRGGAALEPPFSGVARGISGRIPAVGCPWGMTSPLVGRRTSKASRRYVPVRTPLSLRAPYGGERPPKLRCHERRNRWVRHDAGPTGLACLLRTPDGRGNRLQAPRARRSTRAMALPAPFEDSPANRAAIARARRRAWRPTRGLRGAGGGALRAGDPLEAAALARMAFTYGMFNHPGLLASGPLERLLHGLGRAWVPDDAAGGAGGGGAA